MNKLDDILWVISYALTTYGLNLTKITLYSTRLSFDYEDSTISVVSFPKLSSASKLVINLLMTRLNTNALKQALTNKHTEVCIEEDACKHTNNKTLIRTWIKGPTCLIFVGCLMGVWGIDNGDWIVTLWQTCK